MNTLGLHQINNIKVKQDNGFDHVKVITVTVTDKYNKDFELMLFTDKDFVPNLEIEHVND